MAHSDAFDVSTSGTQFKINSAKYKIDLVIDLYPPIRAVITRLQLRSGIWGLKADANQVMLTCDGKDSTQLHGGRAIVHAPALFDCTSETKRIAMNGGTMTGTSPRSRPHESLVRETVDGGFFFPWPLYVIVKAADDTPMEQVELAPIAGTPILPLFTVKKLATAGTGIPDGHRVVGLKQRGLTRVLREVAVPRGLSPIIIDPDVTATEHYWQPKPTGEFADEIEAMDKLDIDQMVEDRGKEFFDASE